jgi:transglycosylase-like protein with SLT domain
MNEWTEPDLRRQFTKAQTMGWLPLFQQSAQETGFPVEFLMAIASRETNMTNKRGDYRNGQYNGFGIMQIDRKTDPGFCASWNAADVQPAIHRGASILAEKSRSLLSQRLPINLEYIACAYNCGQGTVVKAILDKQDPNLHTTGGDYGRDVIARMDVFDKLLHEQNQTIS